MSTCSRKPVTILNPSDILIAPSILAADFATLGNDVADVASSAEVLHIDIMDGHFVPNLSMGPGVVKSLRKQSDMVFDVHLMITDPLKYIHPFADAGADSITVHVESNGDIAEAISMIHDCGCSAGITLKPGTSASAIMPYLDMVELVLVMTVEPGFGGQSFMEGQIPKIRTLKEAIDRSGRSIHLEVDGGIAVGTACQVIAAGANMLVAGSSVFHAKTTRTEAIEAIRADRLPR